MAAHEPRRGSAQLVLDKEAGAGAAGVPQAFDQDEAWVFFNGEQRRYRDSRLGLMTHALHYGTASFGGIQGYWNEQREQLYLFRAREHFERLHQSAGMLRMKLPYSAEHPTETAIQLLRRHQFRRAIYL